MICVYSADCTDFSSNGLGAVAPQSCSVTETLNGEWELTLIHPIDDLGKWRRLIEGSILRAPVPAAMTPQVNQTVQSSAETLIYRVSTSRDPLRLRSGTGTNYKILGKYKKGTQVIVLAKTTSSWYEVSCPDGKRGYMVSQYLAYVRTEAQPTVAIGEVIESRQLRDQPFRIYRVVPELDKITVYARHIFYDLLDNMLQRYEPSSSASGAAVAQNISSSCLSEHDFTFYSALTSTAEEVCFENVNPVEAILGEGGVVEKYGAELARDWFDVFLVQRVGSDTNVQIREKKNLLGISYDVDLTNVVTRIIPTGEDGDGSILYLPELYVDSQYMDRYPHPKWIHLPVSEAKEVTDGDGRKTRDQCYTAMREAARAEYDKGCDLPTVTLKVDFIHCAETEEYRQYTFLQDIFLGDAVRVIAPRIGVEVSMRMTQYTYDCLTHRYTAMTLGSVADTLEGNVITARQLPSGIITGGKLAINSVGTGALQNGSVGNLQIRNAAIDIAHIRQAAIDQLSANALTALRADIRELAAGSITTDQLYADIAVIAAACLTTANIQNANIDWAQIGNLTAEIADLAKAQITTAAIGEANIEWAEIDNLSTFVITTAKAQITTATIKEANIDWAQVSALMAQVATVSKAQITTANINQANIDWASIAALTAVTADIADARIGAATISTAQIDQLEAEVARILSVKIATGEFDFASVQNLVASAMVLEQGVGGSVYITNLAVTSATILPATMGELVVQGEDGKYYEITVMTDGTIATQEVTVTAGEIAAGETAGGKGIVATTANVAELNAQTVKAKSAIISEILVGALTAEKITAQQALLASATVPELYATSIRAIGESLDLSSNQSIRLYVSEQVSEQVSEIKVGARNYIRKSRDLSYGEYGIVAHGEYGVWQQADILYVVSGVTANQNGGVLTIS